MRKYLWVVALLIASLAALPAAADDLVAPLDQEAFLQDLAQTGEAPETQNLIGTPEPLPANYCPGIQCFTDQDCYRWCPGGEGASFCNELVRRCYPY